MFKTDQLGDWLFLGNAPDNREQVMALRTAGTGVSASPYMASWPHETWPGALCVSGPAGDLYLPTWQARADFHAVVTHMLELSDQWAADNPGKAFDFNAYAACREWEAVVDVPMAQAA